MKRDLEKVLKELKPYRERKAEIDSRHAALLVIDIQNFFHRIVRSVLENIQNVTQSCRQRNIPIIFTQHGHADPSSDAGVLGEWWGQIVLRGTEDWKFLPEIEIEPEDTVLAKTRYSAFYQTDLENLLRSKGIRDLIISGVMTNLCCETTARDAFMRDYRVFFLIAGARTGATR